jgi:hypothetical protein
MYRTLDALLANHVKASIIDLLERPYGASGEKIPGTIIKGYLAQGLWGKTCRSESSSLAEGECFFSKLDFAPENGTVIEVTCTTE